MLLTNWLWIEVPTTFSLCLINLLEQLTEPREALTYIYQCIIKDNTKDRDEERHTAKLGKRVEELPCVPEILAIQKLPECSPFGFFFFFFFFF